MFSHAQKLMISDIISLATNKGFDFLCQVKDGFLLITFTRPGESIYYDEADEQCTHATRRYYFLKKIIKNIGNTTLYYNE